MLELRIEQKAEGEGRHRAVISLEGDGPRRTAESVFPFSLSPQDEEGLRWYLEDFLQYPQAPAPVIAQRIEGRMAEMGTELFRAVFQANDDTRRVWSRVEERLPETRIEIITSVAEAATIPWELLREPGPDAALALTVHSFVRAQPNTARAVDCDDSWVGPHPRPLSRPHTRTPGRGELADERARRLPFSTPKSLERPNLLDAREVSVVVQEHAVMLQDELSDQAVDRASEGQALAAAIEIDAGCFPVAGPWIARKEKLLTPEILVEEPPFLLVLGSLKDLLAADPRDGERDLTLDQTFQAGYLRRVLASKEADEDRRIDDDHGCRDRRVL